jgi:hypothetical protein
MGPYESRSAESALQQQLEPLVEFLEREIARDHLAIGTTVTVKADR